MFFFRKKKEEKEVKQDSVEAIPGTMPVNEDEEDTEEVRSPETKEEQVDEKKPGMEKESKGFFSRLKERLTKTKNNLITRVKEVIRLRGKIDENLLEDIEEILIQADVGVETTTKITDRIREQARARGFVEAEKVTPLFKEILSEILRKNERLLKISDQRPFVILVVGVNGTGKTTTIGKLAKHFKSQGLSTMLVAGDTFRAAAVEQLEIWAERTQSAFVKQDMGADPASVCFDALHSARSKNIDVVLIDTAGRLHTKVNLMAELEKIVRVIKKVLPEAPHESLIVLDATTGQNAISQMNIFSKAVPLSGLVMTKLDGTAKGGILIAIRDLFNVPILKIGIGEQVDDLRDFNPGEFVEALFEDDAM
jgi:fused signal recognition particle receptor